jgi:hypothetical protein
LRLRFGGALRHTPQGGDNLIVQIDGGFYHTSYMVASTEAEMALESLLKTFRKWLLRYNLR